MSLLNLRIRGRLYGGFGALLLFCAALAGFGVWQLTAIRDQIGTLSRQSQNAVRVGEITTNLQAIRRGILRYAFDQDEASLADADKRLDRVTSLLDEGVRMTANEERQAAYREAGKDVAEVKAKRAALGDAVKQMLAGRALLFSDGDKMAADVQKFVDAADKTSLEQAAGALESKVLLVRVANWRMLATRDAKGFATFKTNVAKAQQQITQLEKADLPSDLAALLALVKTGVARYAEAFEKTGPNLVLGDELYYKGITPAIVGATEKMDKTTAAIRAAFENTDAETNDRITTTITMQEAVAGATIMLGLLIAFLIARGIILPLAEPYRGNEGTRQRQFRRGAARARAQGQEVGDMAQAVEGFKVKAEEKARDEAEAKIRQDEVVVRQRKADMQKLADSFEAAVGQIIETVSSASTELEASAGTLTKTAERAQQVTNDGRGGFGRGLHQRAVGGLGDRGDGVFRQRDQPTGAGIGADGERGGRPGAHHDRARQRIVEGGDADRRRRRTDQHHCRPDQFAGAQRHHRGGTRGRSRPRFRGGRIRSQGARRADREGDRRDRPADHRHPGRDPGLGDRDQGNLRHDRKTV